MESNMPKPTRKVEKIKQLWNHIFGDEKGFIATFTGRQSGIKANDLVDIQQRFFEYPQQLNKAAEYLLEESERGRDAYFGAHLFKDNVRRTKEYAADEVLALWADADAATVPDTFPQPTAIVESSPGRTQLYWRLTQPIGKAEAEHLNRRIADGMGADSGWGLGKVLRAPGTMNYKRDEPVEVKVTISGGAHDLRAFDVVPEIKVADVRITAPIEDEPPVVLRDGQLEVWRGEAPKYKDTGEVDKSATLMKIGRALYDAGATRNTIVSALKDRDEILGYEKYLNRPEEYERIVDKLDAEGRITGRLIVHRTKGTFPLTDYGNAERLAHRHGKNIRYVGKWGKFLVWDGRRWVEDDPEFLRVKALAKDTVRAMYSEASKPESEQDRKKLADWAKTSESASKINNMVSLVKSEASISIQHDALDGDPWLLNCNNGTLDLKTGELREHRREDLITKLAPVDFDPNATAPTFEAFLREILPSESVRRFVQRVIGYSLNGTTREHKLPIFFGSGANGKGTLLNVLLDVVGDYGMQAANELLMSRQNSHPTDQADLFGKRFVTNQETEEGQRLNESLVKQMTGGDKIRARRMREDFWQFEPTHTLFLATNHKPIIRGTDNAIWRRLRLVPFIVEIPEDEQDRTLPARLRQELSGILAWAVRGHMDWLQDGLGEPEEVKAATSAYRSEMDVLKDFIEDRCVVNANVRAVAGDLYEAYEEWCAKNGERALSQTVFGRKLTERGFDPIKSNGTRYRIGVTLSYQGERPSLLVGEYEIFSDGTLSKNGVKVEGRVAGSGTNSSIAREDKVPRERIGEMPTLSDTRPCGYGLNEDQLESAEQLFDVLPFNDKETFMRIVTEGYATDLGCRDASEAWCAALTGSKTRGWTQEELDAKLQAERSAS